MGPRASRWGFLAAGAAGTLGVAAGLNAAPILTANDALRLRLLPRLAGLGRRDGVALTFDDGPDPQATPHFLVALDALGWKATFFVLGDMVRAAPGLLCEIVDAGHEVGLHGDRHRSHARRTPWAVAEDIARSLDLVQEVTGTEVRFFRPPYGSLGAGSLLGARRHGLTPVLWSAWGRDWRAEATPASVVDDLRPGLEPGATLLLHDSDCTSFPGAWRSALGALPLLADELAARGIGEVRALADHGLVPAR